MPRILPICILAFTQCAMAADSEMQLTDKGKFLFGIIGIIIACIIIYLIVMWAIFPHTNKEQMDRIIKRAFEIEKQLESQRRHLEELKAIAANQESWAVRADSLLEAIEKNTRK